MRSQRSRPAYGRRLAPGFVALAASMAVAGCTAAGPGAADPGPPRLTPNPQHDVAAAMVEGRPAADERLNACELLDLTTEEVIDLTDAHMPEVDPTGSGDLGLLCTYGGPGSPERYEAALSGADTTTTDAAGTDTTAAETAATTTTTATETETTATDTETETSATATATAASATDTAPAPAWDPDVVPDTFAAGVVTPRGGAQAALAGHAALLGARYACSEIRGTAAAAGEATAGELAAPAAPAAPAPLAAPAPVAPVLATAYLDCVAAPTGGGVEAHTVFVSGDELWHITLLQPETPRWPQAEADALVGLHRVAEQIIA